MQARIYITCLMQVSFHIQVAWEENKSPQIYYIIIVLLVSFVKKKKTECCLWTKFTHKKKTC